VTARAPLDPARRRRRRWVMILAATVTVVLMAIPGAVLFVRGTRAGELADPTTSEQGARCGLVRRGEQVPVRCAMIVDAPPDRVWAIIADYRRFADLFDSRMWRLELGQVDPEGENAYHVVGAVRSVLGTWPIDVRMRHAERDGVRRASWDASDGWDVNRGGWSVAPAADGRTLLAYELEVRTRRSPTFLINDVLLDQLPHMLRTVARAAQAEGGR
jgi:uncharacterized protein YndB with AHSA1/START domain